MNPLAGKPPVWVASLPRTMRKLRVIFIICAIGVGAVLAGCGGVPSDSVATIGSVDIKKRTFDHWLGVAFRQQQSQAGGAANTRPPDAPNFTRCVADKKRTATRPARGQPNPTDADYRRQCQTEYNALRDSTMSLLINSEWLLAEAKSLGIAISDEQVRRDFLRQKDQSFSREADFNRFLRESGYTIEDILYRVKIASLTTRIRTSILSDQEDATERDLRNYYDRNRSDFGEPEKRDVRIVLARTQARANQAKSALEDGESFRTVARRYSTDQTSRGRGGLLSGVSKGQLETALDRAVFAARRNALVGPVRTQFGYYVFRVVKTEPGTQQPYAAVKEQIRQTVNGQRQQTALNEFVQDFTRKWTSRSDCRKGYTTSECKNGPATSTGTSTVAPGAIPQQQNAPPASGTTTPNQ